MSGNSFGQLFKITTCGESHGGAVAVIAAQQAYLSPKLRFKLSLIAVSLDKVLSPRPAKKRILFIFFQEYLKATQQARPFYY
jgi:chorismate synthase